MTEMRFDSLLFETSRGPLEYVAKGEGKAILGFHGNQGGYDQGLWLYKPFVEAGFYLVSVSRPGYLRTPLETGPTFREQASAAAELVEHLGLGPVGVVGASAGGPPAYEFAINHPGLTKALVSIDGICRTFPMPSKLESAANAVFLSKTGIHLVNVLARHFPKAIIQSILGSCSDFSKKELKEHAEAVISDPEKRAVMTSLLETMDHFDLRKKGTFNDYEQANRIDKLDVGRITAPSLIIHGTRDTGVSTGDAEYAASTIPGAEMHWIRDASHFGFWLADEGRQARDKAVEFFRKHL